MIMMKRYKKILLTGMLSALSCSFGSRTGAIQE